MQGSHIGAPHSHTSGRAHDLSFAGGTALFGTGTGGTCGGNAERPPGLRRLGAVHRSCGARTGPRAATAGHAARMVSPERDHAVFDAWHGHAGHLARRRVPCPARRRHDVRRPPAAPGRPALFSILTTYILTYLLDHRGDSGPGLRAILVVSALSLLSTPFWGWVSDRVGRRRLAIASALGMAVFIWPFFAFLDNGPLLLLPLVVGLGMNLLHDAIYGPQAAWFAEQFPTEVRYTGVSLGYQLGSIVSVGLTPLLAVWFVQIGDGSPWLLCLYLDAFAVLSIIAALAARDGAAERLQLVPPAACGVMMIVWPLPMPKSSPDSLLPSTPMTWT